MRKTIREVIDSIKSAIGSDYKPILEISKDADLDWATTQKWLEALSSLGYVEEKVDGNKRLFKLRQFSPTKDTLFNIPVSDKDRELIYFIYAKTREAWKKKNGNSPGRSHVHKVLAWVNSKLDLKLPVGWYMYGEACILAYEESTEYVAAAIENEEKVLAEISNGIAEYSKYNHSTQRLRNAHYENANNKLYQLKEKVLAKRFVPFDSSSLYDLSRILLEMIPHLPARNRNTIELFTEYMGTLIDISKHFPKKEEEKTLTRKLVFDSFEAMWKLVAMQSLIDSLISTGKYSEDQLKPIFQSNHQAQKQMVIELVQELIDVSNLNNELKIDVEKLNEDQKKLLQLKGSGKKISEAEKKELDGKWENEKDRSKILREFGFD